MQNRVDAMDAMSDDETSPVLEAVVHDLHDQRERARRLDRMRHAVQTGDKMREMSLWDDDLVYGDDMRWGRMPPSIGFAYLLEKHAFAKKNASLINLSITDTSDVLPLASAEAAVQDPIFKFRVDYNGLWSFGTGRTRREAREMASLQMLRLLYPGPWTFGALCDFWFPPPPAPPDPWKQEMGREERSAKSARKDPPSSVYR